MKENEVFGCKVNFGSGFFATQREKRQGMPRILVVDEESDICRLIQRCAEHDGYDTVGVSDQASAVALCRREDFDLVIMDIMMPDMDGYTACRRIQAYKDIPVLMLSARGEEVDKLYGFEVGPTTTSPSPSPQES